MIKYEMKRSAAEIDALISKCVDLSALSRFPGMTYEQGIRETLEWIIGDTDDYPLPEA